MSSELTQEHPEQYLDPDESFDENYVNNNYVKIPDWHMAIIEERMARYENADTSTWRTWEEFEKELLEKLAKPLTD